MCVCVGVVFVLFVLARPFFDITLQVQSALEVLSEEASQHKAALKDKVQTRKKLGCMQ